MAGYITTASNYKDALLEQERDIFGNATWKSAYANLDYQQQLAESQLNRQFGQEIGTAYQAAMQQRSGVLGSNLGTGYKDAALRDIDDALNQAYNTYIGSLSEARADIAEQGQAAYGQLNEMLSERAENMAEFDREHYNYLVAVDKWYQEHGTMPTEEGTPNAYDTFMSNENFAPFYYTDPNTGMKRLMTYEELATPRVDPVTGEYVSLYDAEGNLTPRGTNFYDILENYYAQRIAVPGELTPPSFAAYLYEANPELYEWANEYNPFSYTPTGIGVSQNIGAFKQLVGLRSDDETYSFMERYGGLSRTEINNVFSDLFSELDKENVTFEDISAGIDKFKGLADRLGYKSVDWDQIKKTADSLYTQYGNLESARKAEIGAATTATVTGVAEGVGAAAAAAAAVLAWLNPAGLLTGPTAGTALGATATGLAGGAVASGTAADNARRNAEQILQAMQNKELDAKDLYLTTLGAMAAEVQSGYTQQQIANGGRYGHVATERTQLGRATSLSDWSKSTDIPMSDAEYRAYLSQVQSSSARNLEYDKAKIIYGGDWHMNVKVGGDKYSVGVGEQVGSRAEQFLNQYATGNKNTPPANNTIVKVNNELYVRSRAGWHIVTSKNNNANEYNELLHKF